MITVNNYAERFNTCASCHCNPGALSVLRGTPHPDLPESILTVIDSVVIEKSPTHVTFTDDAAEKLETTANALQDDYSRLDDHPDVEYDSALDESTVTLCNFVELIRGEPVCFERLCER